MQEHTKVLCFDIWYIHGTTKESSQTPSAKQYMSVLPEREYSTQ